MIKRTLYFGNPAYLSTKNEQLIIKLPQEESSEEEFIQKQVPIEDIGVIIVDNPQITITQGVFEKLLQNNSAIIICNSQHLPSGLLLNLDGNTLQTERFRHQITASIPLKKQLWQQTVIAKIQNQQKVLQTLHNNPANELSFWASKVNSGDTQNIEARAAAYYWKNLFINLSNFTRDREGNPPNNLLNYAYAILRAIVARSLVGSGLLPTLGIHHRNKYNAYCLADDIMEPYRPFVDNLIFEIISQYEDYNILTKEIKAKILTIPVLDVKINDKSSPLMIAVGITTASLYKCFSGEQRKISYPEIN